MIGCASSTPKPAAQAARAPVEQPEPALPAVHERGGDKIIVDVGEAGGTLELDNGARLEIPRGAFGDTVEVTFSRGTKTTAFSNHDWERTLGPTLEIAPTSTLAERIKVSIPLTSLPEGFAESDLALGLEVVSSEQRAVQMHGVQTRWDYLPAAAVAGRVVAELDTLPGYRVQFVVSKTE